jgi:magnesium transporter
MARTDDIRADVHEAVRRVSELLHKHQLVEGLVHRQQGPRQELVESLVQKLHLVELNKLLDAMHPADIADLLDALPIEQRLVVWEHVRTEREGEVLLEVSDAVRETLIASMDETELVAAAERLDTDEIADLAPDLPREVMQDVFRSLSPEEREQLRSAMSYPEGAVGALMDFDMISIRDDVTVEVVLRYLRRLDEMPDHTDQLFVVDHGGALKGLLPVHRHGCDAAGAGAFSSRGESAGCRQRVRALRPGVGRGRGRRGAPHRARHGERGDGLYPRRDR